MYSFGGEGQGEGATRENTALLLRARGGKTTLAQIASHTPEKFREPKHLAESLLNRLERQSRGSRGPQTIAPFCAIDLFDERTWNVPERPVKPREFHLKPLSRAA